MLAGKKKNTIVAMALMGGGLDSSTQYITQKFAYETDAFSMGSQLAFATMYSAAFGNTKVGLFFQGNTSIASSSIYYYRNDAVTSGAVLAQPRKDAAGASTDVTGIIIGGYGASASRATSEKYTYANSAISFGGNLTTGRGALAGAGNLSTGIFSSGASFALTNTAKKDKYTYANDSVVATTNATVAKRRLAASANDAIAVIAGGYTSSSVATTEKHMFSDDAVFATSALALARHWLSGTGNKEVAIFAGGGAGSPGLANVDKYIYSSGVMSPSKSLTISQYAHSATSASPGWVV